MFSQDNSCPDLLYASLVPQMCFRVRGYHPLLPDFPDCSTNTSAITCRAAPLSLAATKGISVDFFSSGYLDVSVPLVRSLHLCIQCKDTCLYGWVSPFGNLRIKVCLPTPRSLSQATRPSSPLTAKASTVCAYSLDHIAQACKISCDLLFS